jgi:hypothetical protein
MPVLGLWGWLLWLAKIGAQLALCVILLRGRHWRTWPALCSYVFASTAVALSLLGIFTYDLATGCKGDTLPMVYYVTHYAGAAVLGVLKLWIVYELACSVAPASRALLRRLIPVLVLVSAIISAAVVDYHPDLGLAYARIVLTADRIVGMAWLMSALFFPYSAEIFGIFYKKRELTISIGFTLLLLSECIVSLLIGAFPQSAGNISFSSGVTFIFTLSIWAHAFLSAFPAPEPALPPAALLKRRIDALTALAKQIRGQR